LERIVELFFNLEVMIEYAPRVLDGFFLTVAMALAIIVLGLGLGLGLAVVRLYGIRPLNWLLIFYVDVFRAVPALVIIYLLYFALPYAGLTMNSVTATVLTLTLILAAFSEEIYWSSILSLPAGQWEAGRSTGLSFLETIAFVVVPQAVRRAIPMLTNRAIAITKGTALGSTVAVQEILNQALSAQSIAANPSPLTLGSLLYLVIFAPMVTYSRWIERRYGWVG